MKKERLDNIIGALGNFMDFSKRLAEIAEENDVPYDEIWECWKEQRNTVGTNTTADFHRNHAFPISHICNLKMNTKGIIPREE